MVNLHSAGWRQGSLLNVRLPVSTVVLGFDGAAQAEEGDFDRWIVCSQDCDLAAAAVDEQRACIELRPIVAHEGVDPGWGLRSKLFAITAAEVVEASAPRAMVAPALLQSLVSERDDALPLHRRRAFKTWLGLRYDRPAVPDHLVEAAREVAKRCGSRGGRDLAEGVHDVLMQFDDAQTPPHIALYAVAADDADPEQIERWLSAAAQQIPSDVGVVSAIVVGTRSEISLELMETSYAADVSQLTWSGEEPVGAE